MTYYSAILRREKNFDSTHPALLECADRAANYGLLKKQFGDILVDVVYTDKSFETLPAVQKKITEPQSRM